MPAGSAEQLRADDSRLSPPPPNEILPEHPSSLDFRKDARPAYTSVPEPPEPGAPGITVSGELLPGEIDEMIRRLGIERPRGPERRVVTRARSPSRDACHGIENVISHGPLSRTCWVPSSPTSSSIRRVQSPEALVVPSSAWRMIAPSSPPSDLRVLRVIG